METIYAWDLFLDEKSNKSESVSDEDESEQTADTPDLKTSWNKAQNFAISAFASGMETIKE